MFCNLGTETITKKHTAMTELLNLLTYLKEKKVPFALPLDKNMNVIVKYPDLEITKKGKFYYANGVLVAKNMIKDYLN